MNKSKKLYQITRSKNYLKTFVATQKLYGLHFELLWDPLYSPNQILSEYFLHLDLKKKHSIERDLAPIRKQYTYNLTNLKAQEKSVHKNGIEMLERCWRKECKLMNKVKFCPNVGDFLDILWTKGFKCL